MRKISSSMTYFTKRIFPVIWFSFFAFIVVQMGLQAMNARMPWPFLLFPLAMGVFSFFIFKNIVLDLADEVQDDGHQLRVKKGSLEAVIPIKNILNVSYSSTNPPRITLTLKEPTPLGTKVVFSPKQDFSFGFFKNAVAEDLIKRSTDAHR